MKTSLISLLLLLGLSGSAWADRVKDLASVAAGRTNQLIGYGLVVGLQGTGDGADVSFTAQSMKAMLARLGVGIDGPLSDFEQSATSGKIDIKNVAAVMVTAELPGFAKPGQKIDINVSAIGKASSLRGGSLLLTSLRGVDGEIYSLAQGALTATGVETSAAGSKVSTGVAFTFSAGGTIKGCLLSANSTRDGTTGILFSAGLFSGGDKVVASSDVVTVTYTLSA